MPRFVLCSLSLVVPVAVVTAARLLPADTQTPAAAATVRVTTASPAPRVLLIGDSIMDQEGSHAAVLLRQAGARVVVNGIWGSSILTRGQYDGCKVDVTPAPGEEGHWLSDAKRLVDDFRPDIVAVHL